MKPSGLLLHGAHIDPARAGDRVRRLPFLSRGPVRIAFQRPLTFFVGENGSGKTTLLEAIAARCAIRPGGGGSYAETEDREATAISEGVAIAFAGSRPPRGLFLRADRFAETMASAGMLPMPGTSEWRRTDEQSRGEGVLALLSAQVDASEGKLFILDEPETGLSPRRQMALLRLLDDLHRDGRSQALVATHSPILMSHADADRLWIDAAGIDRRELEAIEHWRTMRRFMAASGQPSAAQDARREKRRLWVLSDLHLEAVPFPGAYRPKTPEFDVLVVAGDVWEGDVEGALRKVAELAAGKPAVFVLGNGELAGDDLDGLRAAAARAAQVLGIVLLDDREIELCGIGFVGGTLWTEADGGHAALHRRTRGLIEAVAARPRASPLVVVTHHAPDFRCLPEADRNGPEAGDFASDLSSLTESGKVALWVHGHIHGTMELARPGGTRIVCNAAGQGFQNPAFRDDWVIEV